MDKVKLGRALGYGARHAVKTLAKAADAATSPSPTPQAARRESPVKVLRETVQAYQTAKGEIRTEAKRSIFAPLKKFSSVLWLEVTGTFFAIVAVYVGQGLWRLRGAATLSARTPDAQKLYLHAVLFGLFVYFAVSSFVRARRRGRV